MELSHSRNSVEYPDWRNISDDLRANIETGLLPPGAKLPSLEKLASESNASVHGARKAISLLKDTGHVVGWRGKGNFVSEDRFAYRLGRRTRFSVNLSVEGKVTDMKIIGHNQRPAPRHVTMAFGLRSGAPLQRAELLRVVQGRPASLARHYYLLSPRFDGILDLVAKNGSITKAFAECGVADFTRRDTSISARLPNAHEALLLEIPRAQPVLVSIGVNIDSNESVVEVSEAVSRADRITLIA